MYANRLRVQGNYGKRFLRRRSELVERNFAHCYDTGGMRRTRLRKHNNIVKRQLIHVAGFNLSLIFRKLLGGHAAEIKQPGRGAVWASFAPLRPAGKRPQAHMQFRRLIRADAGISSGRHPTVQAVPEIPYLHHKLLGTRMHPGDAIIVPEEVVGNSMLWRNLIGTAQVMSSVTITGAVTGSL